MSDTTPTPIALECGECEEGNYYRSGFAAGGYECDVCGHSIDGSDIDLDEGERITLTSDGALAYIPASDEDTQECTCEPHITRMSHFGTAVYCETEQNAYCNFECTCGADSDY